MGLFSFNRINRKVVIASVITTVLLMFLCYIITNLGFSIDGEGGWVSKFNNNIKKIIGMDDAHVPDSILLVNIAYDKELIPIDDSDGFPIGEIDITNRGALFQFLSILEKRNDYKYIFLDVFFEKGYDSPNDDNLFPLISRMRDIVIPRHRDAQLGHLDLLNEKAYVSDYTVTKKSSSFTKYELLTDSLKSIALKIYNDRTGKDISRKGLFYSDGGRLCNSTLFAKQIINFNSPYDNDGNKNYYNLSADLLADTDELMTTPLLKDKYIFIGAMELNDIHGTYEGSLPGVVITANTFLSLTKGQHMIPFVLIVLLFLILLFISIQVYSGNTMASVIKKYVEKRKWKLNPYVLSYIVSWVSYISVLSVVCIMSYMIYGVIYDIFFTATIFQNIDFFITNIYDNKKGKAARFKDYVLGLIFK